MYSPQDIFSNGNCLSCGHASTVHGIPWMPITSPTSYTVRVVCNTDLANAQTNP